MLAFILIFTSFHLFILKILVFIFKPIFLRVTLSESEVVLKHLEPIKFPSWMDLGILEGEHHSSSTFKLCPGFPFLPGHFTSLQAHVQAGLWEQLGLSPASPVHVWELIKALCHFLTKQVSPVDI